MFKTIFQLGTPLLIGAALLWCALMLAITAILMFLLPLAFNWAPGYWQTLAVLVTAQILLNGPKISMNTVRTGNQL